MIDDVHRWYCLGTGKTKKYKCLEEEEFHAKNAVFSFKFGMQSCVRKYRGDLKFRIIKEHPYMVRKH